MYCLFNNHTFLRTTPTSSVTTTESSKMTFDELNVDEEDARKAKVLYDFDAEHESQVTVLSGQVS